MYQSIECIFFSYSESQYLLSPRLTIIAYQDHANSLLTGLHLSILQFGLNVKSRMILLKPVRSLQVFRSKPFSGSLFYSQEKTLKLSKVSPRHQSFNPIKHKLLSYTTNIYPTPDTVIFAPTVQGHSYVRAFALVTSSV